MFQGTAISPIYLRSLSFDIYFYYKMNNKCKLHLVDSWYKDLHLQVLSFQSAMHIQYTAVDLPPHMQEECRFIIYIVKSFIVKEVKDDLFYLLEECNISNLPYSLQRQNQPSY